MTTEVEEARLVDEEEKAVELHSKSARELLPHHKIALRLWVLGKRGSEIEQATGTHPAYLSVIRKSEKGKDYLRQIEEELDADFLRLFQKSIKVLDRGLDSMDMGVALASVNLSLKKMGKFVHKTETRNLTAEDIVQKILSGELQVGRREPMTIDGVVVSRSLDDEEKDMKELPS